MLHFTFFTHLTNSQGKNNKQQEISQKNLVPQPSFISMAPQNKITSNSGCVYELNNFTACVNTADAP